MRKRIAVAFLCKELNEKAAEFYSKVYEETDLEVFAIIDNFPIYEKSHTFCTPFISDQECIDLGYRGTNIDGKRTHIQKQITAWDKALLYFCEIYDDFDFVWFVEDDVFIPTENTLQLLSEKYSDYDLVVPNNIRKEDQVMDWHWKQITPYLEGPYFYSMVCACGMSSKMLREIQQFTNEQECLVHHEALFTTLANKQELSIIDPLELKTIVWKGAWGLDDILTLPNNLFHPFKILEQHEIIRKAIESCKELKYPPANKLPPFILAKLNSLEN